MGKICYAASTNPLYLPPTADVSGTTPAPNDLLAGLGDTREEAAARALDILKRIEQSGGSAAFETWLKETGNGTAVQAPPEAEAELAQEANSAILSSNFASLSANSWSGEKVYPVFIKIFSIAAYSIIEMYVEGTNYKGTGGAWGVGVGYFRYSAHLYLEGGRTIESLLSDVSRFWFYAGAGAPGVGGAIVKFYNNNGNDVGSAKGFGVGIIGGIGFKGDFNLYRSVHDPSVSGALANGSMDTRQ
ncbi:hypothetical protein FS749_007149 [Ceratobasidium sp. UAMH 11750]|nr:hypothetical protein FS749_007149 [Ceratobasidium sp. UAMH 11750]